MPDRSPGMSHDTEYVLLDRGLVRISGADRYAFLQGLVSQDVDKVSSRQAAYATLLSPQGKYLHDFFLVSLGDSLVLDGEPDRVEELAARLRRYKLRAKVDISAAADLSVAVMFGASAAPDLHLPDEPGAAREFAGGIAFIDPRNGALGCRIVAPGESLKNSLATASAGSHQDYDCLRISLGIPDGSRDMIVDKSTLLESGIERCNGIDWNKGCYIGQEVTARMKHRGLAKRGLVPVAIEGGSPAPGTPVTLGGKEIGEIRSVCAGRALASLRLDMLDGPDSGPKLEADGTALSLLPV